MENYTTERVDLPLLLAELWALLEGARPIFRQERVFRRAVALLFGELFTFARHTVTQVLRSLGLTDADWSAWYRLFSQERFDEEKLGSYLLQQTLRHVPADQPYVMTIDGVCIPRTGQRVAGSSWWPAPNTAPFRRGLQRGQRFVEGAWLTPIEEGFSRAIPLRWIAAPTERAVPSAASPCKEWEAGVAVMQWARVELDRAGRKEQWLFVMGDGNYDVNEIWNRIPERTVLMAQCAKNRALYALPERAPGKPGRPPRYGERMPSPRAWLRRRKGWQRTRVLVRGREIEVKYRVVGPVLVEGAPDHPLFLVLMRGKQWKVGKRRKRVKRRKPVCYLVSAVRQNGQWELPLPVVKLLAWAWQRWEAEVAHREMKSGLGIGDKQCWGARSALTAVQWGVWVYSTLLLAGYRAWGITGGPRLAGRWWRGARRWSFSALWQAYRAAMWGCGEFRTLWTGTADNWVKKETLLAGLWNAVAGAARI